MSVTAIMLIVAIGYPIYQWRKHAFIDRTDQAMRAQGIKVPAQRNHRSGGETRRRYVKQPPRGTGMRGPIEGRFWGTLLGR
jgi:hypothetical protein